MKSPLLLCLVLLFTACASDKVPQESAQKDLPVAKVAPIKITDSLNVASLKGSSITIKKKSLGTLFLMSMAIKSSAIAPRINILLPKVVSFALNGSELALLEENIYSIYGEVPHGKLLQTFTVESQDDESVTFKWSYGLASIPTKGFYVTSDGGPDSANDAVSESEVSYPVVASYLKKGEVRENRIEITQLARVNSQTGGLDAEGKKLELTNKEETLELNIAFSPYVQNKRFKPRLSTKLQGVGFFEVAQTRKEMGDIDIFASHWDLSPEAGPITYSISNTAPPETVEAIKEGVLYWNTVSQAVLHRDIMAVETNVDPSTPPRPRHVLIYWVPFANAGSAYANFQPDPLTGEITSGIVYQTSVFYLSGKNRGRRFVNRETETKKRDVVPTGFRPAALCDYHDPVADVAPGDLDEKIGLKAGLDYLRHVVAHEVGHTLGLRHNFAGSMASELNSPDEYRKKFGEYLTDDKHQGALVTSSIMDYVPFRDCLFNGALIGAKQRFLPYDKAAIEWAYGEKYVRGEDIPLPPATPFYCGDVEMSSNKVLGCGNGDFSPHPIAGYSWELGRGKLLAADVVIEAILDGIRPDNENDVLSVRQALVKNHPDGISATLAEPGNNFMRLGGAGIKHIGVDRSMRGTNWTNSAEYAAATKAEVAKEYEVAGGLPGFLKAGLDLDDTYTAKHGWLIAAVEEKMAKPDFGRGKTTYGKPFEVKGAELEEAKKAIRKLAEAVENSLIRDVLLSVTGLAPKEVTGGAGKATLPALMAYGDSMKKYEPTLGQDSWAPGLTAIATRFATESSGELEGTVDGNPVKVPAPAFSIEERVAAMRLFSPKVFGRPEASWMKEGSDKLVQSIVDRVAPVVKVTDGDPDKAEPVGRASKELTDWAKKELAVLKALKTARGL